MIIAEIGNNHFGSLETAKELIHAAKESGADMVKSQLFDPDLISGSMDRKFYYECSHIFSHINALVFYSRAIDIPLFFTCFNNTFKGIEELQTYKEVAGSQFRLIQERYAEFEIDNKNTLVSIPEDCYIPKFQKAIPMHVTKYLTDFPKMERLLEMHLNHPKVGYSDHTKGIENCVKAFGGYGASVIEKHFTLRHNMEWKGTVFRDTVHGATPEEFKQLTERVRELCD